MGRSRNRKTAGFTLAETLVAVLIISLVTVIVAGGITVLRDTYQKITLKANAETAVSTTLTAVGDTLRFARPVSGDGEMQGGENPFFQDSASGMKARFVDTEPSGGDDGNIAMQYGSPKDGQKIPVISSQAVTDQFHTKIAYTYDASTKCYRVTVTAVNQSDAGGKRAGAAAAEHTVYFRCLNGSDSSGSSENG